MEIINWEVFTLEEKMYLKKMIKMGNYKDLAAAIGMNVAKENEIEKIRKDLEPVFSEFQSTKVDEFYKEHGRHPENPTEEAELEEAMRIEAEDYKEKLMAKKEKKIKREEPESEESKNDGTETESQEEPEEKPIKKSKKSKK